MLGKFGEDKESSVIQKMMLIRALKFPTTSNKETNTSFCPQFLCKIVFLAVLRLHSTQSKRFLGANLVSIFYLNRMSLNKVYRLFIFARIYKVLLPTDRKSYVHLYNKLKLHERSILTTRCRMNKSLYWFLKHDTFFSNFSSKNTLNLRCSLCEAGLTLRSHIKRGI